MSGNNHRRSNRLKADEVDAAYDTLMDLRPTLISGKSTFHTRQLEFLHPYLATNDRYVVPYVGVLLSRIAYSRNRQDRQKLLHMFHETAEHIGQNHKSRAQQRNRRAHIVNMANHAASLMRQKNLFALISRANKEISEACGVIFSLEARFVRPKGKSPDAKRTPKPR